MARPSIPDKEKRSNRVQLLFNDKEYADLQKAAKLGGMPGKPNLWARAKVMASVRRILAKSKGR